LFSIHSLGTRKRVKSFRLERSLCFYIFYALRELNTSIERGPK
jgi:hypothetical protein